jgi:hypothetical protein
VEDPEVSHGKTKRKVHHGTPISELLEGDDEHRPLPEKKHKPKKKRQPSGKHKTIRRGGRPAQSGGRR